MAENMASWRRRRLSAAAAAAMAITFLAGGPAGLAGPVNWLTATGSWPRNAGNVAVFETQLKKPELIR